MPRPLIIVLALVFALGLPAVALGEMNPLIDVLKQKGIVNEDEAGKLEQQLDNYYKKKLAPPPAPAPAEAKPSTGAPEAAVAVPVEEQIKRLEERTKRNRVNWGGEARFRIMDEYADAPTGWGGQKVQLTSAGAFSSASNQTARHERAISFPLRLRLNWDAQVIPDWVDLFGRFTINKRWGTFSSTPEQDPFNAPNSFAASIGSEIALRAEQIYATIKVPKAPCDLTWYVGRLPGLDGAPSRQARSLFPRIFIDSEIDGTLLRATLPKLPTADMCLPISACPVEAISSKKFRGGPLGQYDAKVAAESNVIVGYLDYNESKLSSPAGKTFSGDSFVPIVGHGPSSDVFLAQIGLKPLKDTEFVLDGLWMPDWYMPRTAFDTNGSIAVQAMNPVFDAANNRWTPGLNIPFFTSDYYLYGGYFDTQILGFQLYGSLYFDILRVPGFSYQLLTTNGAGATSVLKTVSYEGNKFEGQMWHVGMNTGTWLAKYNLSICTEYAEGSDAWINPFNYRGYRRKGTDLYPQPNAFFGGNSVVGFYPFHAKVLDSYLDYYWQKVRFRTGVMWFWHQKNDDLPTVNSSLNFEGGPDRILGMSRYQSHYWPYFEVNMSF